ncbi:hypothetical protein [Niameybacter massiliensis]|uniref:hypothetical protein n=1 Tax=Niameybacter massiliensis TaxID=1658108 RepID=UPI0006B4E953|nr:hypothetical protein [Niameybacter massiliensis]
MARLKGAFQADNGDELYPHTSSDVVFGPDGKTVEEQINGLFDKIGIQFAKWLDNPDYNTLIDFQRYRIGGGTNSPGGGVWYLEVNPIQSGIVFHRAKCVYGGNIGQVKERVLKDGQWTAWKEIATTDFTMTKRFNIENQNVIDFFKNHATLPGIYYIHQNCTGQPEANKFYIATFERSPVGADWKATLSSYNPSNKIYVGDCWNNSFSGWKELAATSKTQFNVTPNTGITVDFQDCYTTNTAAYISFRVSKTDGSTFATGKNTIVAISTIVPKHPILAMTCTGVDVGGDATSNVHGFIRSNGQIEICTTNNNVKNIYMRVIL